MQYRSPGIAEIYNKISSANKTHILDLGQISASFFRVFSSPNCKIHCQSLHEHIVEYLTQANYPIEENLKENFQSLDTKASFDIILSWDLFNYLPLKIIKTFLSGIEQYCKPNTLLYGIRYLDSKIPDLPAQIKMLDEKHLEIKSKYLTQRRFKRYSTYEFCSTNPNYSYLYSEFSGTNAGIGEDIYCYAPLRETGGKQIPNVSHSLNNATKESATYLDAMRGYVSKDLSHYPKHFSPILHSMFNQLRGKKIRILDLGEKIAGNMQILREQFNEVYSDDLLGAIRQQEVVEQYLAIKKTNLNGKILNFGKLVFDVIIFWDILNFCKPSQREAIFARLRRHCRPGTKLIVFNYTGQSVPNAPQTYYLTPQGALHILESPRVKRIEQGLSGDEVTQSTSYFTLRSTQIFRPGMRPGMVEMLFEYTPDQQKIQRQELSQMSDTTK